VSESPFVAGARVAIEVEGGYHAPTGYKEAFVDKAFKTGRFTLRGSAQQWRPYEPAGYTPYWNASQTGNHGYRMGGRLRIWDDAANTEMLIDHVKHPGDDCLIWPFSCARGYGHFKYFRKYYYAHRYMCELANGAPPEGSEAAHSCGRGDQGCVNPKHLSWKTKTQNALDCKDHGTQAKHHTGRHGKLTPEQASEIRISGMKGHELAKLFGVHETTISNIRTGRTRKNLVKDARTGFCLVSPANQPSAEAIENKGPSQ
jgi:hypothetical protein